MESRKYRRIREINGLADIDESSRFNSRRETARQFLLGRAGRVFVSLNGEWGMWVRDEHQPPSAKVGDSVWTRKEPLDSSDFWWFALVGWYQLTPDALWKIAHSEFGGLDVLLADDDPNCDAAFWLEELAAVDTLDLWLQQGDFDRLADILKQTDRSYHVPLKERERRQLYRIIATLIGANYKPADKAVSKLADEIVHEATILGIDVKTETLRKKLPEFLEELPHDAW